MMKHYNPIYSPGVAMRLTDPWQRVLNRYRPMPSWVRKYGGQRQHEVGEFLAA